MDNLIALSGANGVGWNIEEYSHRRLFNYLVVLMGKSLNSQEVFGNGYVGASGAGSNTTQISGSLDDKGLFYGYNDQAHAVKVFGIENYWGNVWDWVDGFVTKYGVVHYKMCEGTLDDSTSEGYNDSGTGYINSGVTIAGGGIKKMKLVPHMGLIPIEGGGGSSNYYCDTHWGSSSLEHGDAAWGGRRVDHLACGIFCLATNITEAANWGGAMVYKAQPSSS